MNNQHDYPKEKRKTLIINYPIMALGGIETCFAALMKECLSKGYRVIWITSKCFVRNVAYDGLLDNPGLEIVLTRPWHHFFGNPRISLTEEERVLMFTCEPLKYFVSEGIRKKADTKHFLHYLAIPHFTENAYYPDRYMKNKWAREHTYRYCQKILGRLAENDCLMGFAPKHLECYEDHYHVPLPDKNKKIIPIPSMEQLSFDIENTMARCAERSDRFVITTCSRFEFPHKAYLLGLVDVFKIIKQKYPQAVLQIIGYGAGEQELKEKIDMLPEFARRDIHLLGAVPPEVLAQHYKNSQLAIGLAGAIIDGARCGIPSLVVRHYNSDCETYGFFENALEKTLSEDSGKDIVPFIEDCITMDPEEYLQHAKKSYDVVEFYRTLGMKTFLERFDKAEVPCPDFIKNPWEAFLGRILYIICSVLRRLGR